MMMNIVLYFCILFPVFRIKSDLLKLLKDSVSYLLSHGEVDPHVHDDDICLLDLPGIRFEELVHRRNTSVDEMCFICSADYDGGDVVCQLSRCGHVFHSNCVGKLLQQKQNNCPFCRSPLFSGLPALSSKSL